MAKFRVILQRPCANQPHTRNPFLIKDIWNIPSIRMICREWEVEARSENQVKKLLDEARKAGAPDVQGFHLHSIERIPVCDICGEPASNTKTSCSMPFHRVTASDAKAEPHG